MNEYHRAKNVFGELTFGEYWNLVGCHAAAFRIKGVKTLGFKFGATESSIKFFWGGGQREAAEIRLDAKVKAFGNKVAFKNSLDREMTIEFFELKPLEFDP